MYEIVEAKRDSAPITAAIIGGSGSGKTYSALKFARGLVGPTGKIVVIDCEGGRSKIYANDPAVAPFYHMDLPAPYTSDRFREAYRAAEAWGKDQKLAIVIDTISHEHEGFLEYADAEEQRMSNRSDKSRSKWIKPKAARKRFYSAISSSHAHTIVTIRLNRIVDMESKPAKEIYKPECDKDLPYRLDLSLQISPDHIAHYIKVPEPLKPFVEDSVMIDVRHGQVLAADVAKQAPVNDKLRATIAALDEVASSGLEIFKTAWEAAWRNTDPKDHPALKMHLDRLKATAIEADQIKKDDEEFPGDKPTLFGQDGGR